MCHHWRQTSLTGSFQEVYVIGLFQQNTFIQIAFYQNGKSSVLPHGLAVIIVDEEKIQLISIQQQIQES